MSGDKISKQVRYQRRHRAMGLCWLCGDKVHGDSPFCLKHRDDARTRRRNLYRRKVGIPLDAPLSKAGRPRKT